MRCKVLVSLITGAVQLRFNIAASQLGIHHEFRDRHVECAGNTRQMHQPDVLIAPFDRAHVRAIDLCQQSEVLLRNRAFPSSTADRCTKCNKDGVAGVFRGSNWHLGMLQIGWQSNHGRSSPYTEFPRLLF